MAEFTLLRGLLCRNCRLELVALGRAGAFLTSIRAEELVNELLWKIIEQNHPATWKRINILLPAQTVPCPVSLAGLLLLALAEEAAGGRPRCRVMRVNVATLDGPLLRALGSTITRQPEKVESLTANYVVINSREEAEVLAQLLEMCTHWRVHPLMFPLEFHPLVATSGGAASWGQGGAGGLGWAG